MAPYVPEINYEAALAAKHVALERLAELVLGWPFPHWPIADLVETYCMSTTDADVAAVREVFPDGRS